MATHSIVLVWRIPGTGEPGGLLSMGSHRVGHNWSDLAAAAAAWSVTITSLYSVLVTDGSLCTDSKVHSDVVSLSSSDKLTWLFTKLDPWNRELANKDESAAKKQKDSGSKIGKWLWTIGWRYPRGNDDSEKKKLETKKLTLKNSSRYYMIFKSSNKEWKVRSWPKLRKECNNSVRQKRYLLHILSYNEKASTV